MNWHTFDPATVEITTGQPISAALDVLKALELTPPYYGFEWVMGSEYRAYWMRQGVSVRQYTHPLSEDDKREIAEFKAKPGFGTFAGLPWSVDSLMPRRSCRLVSIHQRGEFRWPNEAPSPEPDPLAAQGLKRVLRKSQGVGAHTLGSDWSPPGLVYDIVPIDCPDEEAEARSLSQYHAREVL